MSVAAAAAAAATAGTATTTNTTTTTSSSTSSSSSALPVRQNPTDTDTNTDANTSIPIPGFISIFAAPSPPLPVPVPGEYTPPNESKFIKVYHPHYPSGTTPLFQLFAPDSRTGGLQYGYILVVCGIVSGNRWDGWLEEKQGHGEDERSRITKPHNAILPPGEYFFCLENSSDVAPYPICPTFQHWIFPHSRLPEGDWRRYSAPQSDVRQQSASKFSTALSLRDVSCRISGWEEGTEIAHVIPRAEAEWYARNSMNQYQVDNTRTMDVDLANLLLFRQDLHSNFDKPMFTIIPKSTSADEKPQLVFHLMQPSKEYQYLYHNHAVLEWKDISPQFLFARLAWAVFPLLKGFLESGTGRLVTLTSNNLTMETTWLEREACAELSPRAVRSRSQRNKRARADLAEDNDDRDENLEDKVDRHVQSHKCRRISSRLASFADQGGCSKDTAKHDTQSISNPLKPQIQHMQAEAIQDLYPSSPLRSQLLSSSSPPYSLCSSFQAHPPTPGHSPPAERRPPNDLKAEWLQKERARSGVKNLWNEEETWAEHITEKGTVMNHEEAVRLLQYYGAEIKEE